MLALTIGYIRRILICSQETGSQAFSCFSICFTTSWINFLVWDGFFLFKKTYLLKKNYRVSQAESRKMCCFIEEMKGNVWLQRVCAVGELPLVTARSLVVINLFYNLIPKYQQSTSEDRMQRWIMCRPPRCVVRDDHDLSFIGDFLLCSPGTEVVGGHRVKSTSSNFTDGS